MTATKWFVNHDFERVQLSLWCGLLPVLHVQLSFSCSRTSNFDVRFRTYSGLTCSNFAFGSSTWQTCADWPSPSKFVSPSPWQNWFARHQSTTTAATSSWSIWFRVRAASVATNFAGDHPNSFNLNCSVLLDLLYCSCHGCSTSPWITRLAASPNLNLHWYWLMLEPNFRAFRTFTFRSPDLLRQLPQNSS